MECEWGHINNDTLPLCGGNEGLSLRKTGCEGPPVMGDSYSGNRFDIFHWKSLDQMCFSIHKFLNFREIKQCICHLEHDTSGNI